MDQNIPLAIVLQTIGSFCFAMSAYLQHHAVGEETEGNRAKARIGLKQLWESIKNPKWILGAFMMGVSLLMQVLALRMAPVSVVQPVGLLAFPWSIMIQAYAAKRRPERKVLFAVGTTAGATLLLTIITAIWAAPPSPLDQNRVFVGALVIYLAAMGMGWLGSTGSPRWRSLFWASGGAFFYGLEAALVRALQEFAKHFENWFYIPSFWGMVVALVIGSVTAGWMVQQGYATGPAEVVVADMTITSPIVAVLFGIFVLDEGARLTTPVIIAMGVLGLIAIGGVIRLTTLHPSFDEPIPEASGVPGDGVARQTDPHMD